MRKGRPLKAIKMIDSEGKILRAYRDAHDVAEELGYHLSSIYQLLIGRLKIGSYFRLVYDGRQPVAYRHTNNRTMDELTQEIDEFHQKINGKPIERRCTICDKVFMSQHKGNRRCARCNYDVEQGYQVLEYKHK